MNHPCSMTTAQPLVLIVDDDAAVCWALRQVLSEDGFAVEVAADGLAARRLARRHRPDLVITDLRMPGGNGLDLLAALRKDAPTVPVVLTTAYGSLEVAVQATDLGAFGYLPKPLDLDRTLELIRRACGRQRIALRTTPEDDHPLLVGSSPAMQEVFRRIAAAAASNVPVLIQGPSGSGKEVVARSIHHFSDRTDAPFVAINCGAIPSSLIESELFGHVPGAFTGASQARGGRIQSAAGGVLFLDEVGDLPPAVQTRLLRFLDDHRITAVGDTQEVAVDVRVIAASNRPLTGEGGMLRSDLFYRLRGVTITTPSLAERPSDLPALVAALLTRTARRLGQPLALTEAALQAICARQWPGNVREMKHRLEEAAVFAPGGVIDLEHLEAPADGAATKEAIAMAQLAHMAICLHPGEAHAWCLRQALPPLLAEVLRQTEGNYLRASELLGINRVTLKRWTDECGL